MSTVVRRLLVVAVLGFSAWYVATHLADFALLLEANAAYLPGLIGVHVASIFLNGWILKVLLRRLDVELRFVEWFGLTVLHALGNYLPLPQAGSVARGVHLKRQHELGYAPFLATLGVAYAQFLGATGLAGCATLGVLAARDGAVPWPLWGAFSFLLLIPAAAWLLARASGPGSRLVRFRDAMSRLGGWRTLSRVGLLQTGVIVTAGAGLWLSFAALDRGVPPHAALLVALVSTASGLANVTPGNVGVAEAAAWFTAFSLGLDPGQTVVVYALFRLSSLVTVLVLAPVFATSLSRLPRPRDLSNASDDIGSGG